MAKKQYTLFAYEDVHTYTMLHTQLIKCISMFNCTGDLATNFAYNCQYYQHNESINNKQHKS